MPLFRRKQKCEMSEVKKRALRFTFRINRFIPVSVLFHWLRREDETVISDSFHAHFRAENLVSRFTPIPAK